MAVNIGLGLLFGIINTLILHLSKAMERHGIDIFTRKKSFKEKGKKPVIYIVGVILNNTIIIWQIIGTTFASAAVFSSVFGLGLILLMLYSHYILHEAIKPPELIGAILIIAGTTIVGILYIWEPISSENVNFFNFFVLLIIITILFTILIGFSAKTRIGVALIFGGVAGTCGGLDNVFKRIGLKSMNFIQAFAGVFKLDPISFIFLVSFFIGFVAFILTQVGFAKGADASKLVPMYNSLYILAPITFELIIIVDATISIGKIISIAIIVIGIFLMNIFKETEKRIQKENLTENV